VEQSKGDSMKVFNSMVFELDSTDKLLMCRHGDRSVSLFPSGGQADDFRIAFRESHLEILYKVITELESIQAERIAEEVEKQRSDEHVPDLQEQYDIMNTARGLDNESNTTD
jgi:hypothetical protein